MNVNGKIAQWLLSMVGALLGGVVGCLGFFWLVRQGFYGLVLPGATIGLGCAILSRGRSNVRGILCAVWGILLGLFSEWRSAPFVADPGLGYFVGHLHHLQPITLVEILLGGGFAFWFSVGTRNREEP